MAETKVTFDDGDAYERYMGRWSRAAGTVFLDWLTPPQGARWLDVGCGTGAFTQLVLDNGAPGAIVAIDPAAAQIEHARQQPAAQRADFRVADALALPFPDGGFDVVASALVINFIPDRAKALGEMRRVARSGGTVAGYVWHRDLAGDSSPGTLMRRALLEIGADAPRMPGGADSSLAALHASFAAAGLTDIATTPLDVTQSYRDFNDFWGAQTGTIVPATKVIAALSDADRARLRDVLRAALSIGPDGSVSYSARANAVKARVP